MLISNLPQLEPYLWRLFFRFKATLLSHLHILQNHYIHLIHSIDHISINIRRIGVIFGWKSIYWLCLFLMWPSLEAYPRGLYLVLKLQYCLIYRASKKLYIHHIHIIDHISFNKRRIEVIFVWKFVFWSFLFRLCHRLNCSTSACIAFQSYNIIKMNPNKEKQNQFVILYQKDSE